MSERSDGDRTADGLQQVDRSQTKPSSPRLNSVLDPVNGKRSKDFEKDFILSEKKPPYPCSEGETMSSGQTIDADGRMANGQESPVNVNAVENDDGVNTELDNRRV